MVTIIKDIGAQHTGSAMMTPPASLAGIRVLDLAGPLGWYATKLFADLGADVIRVEPPQGDPARQRGPFWHHDRRHSISFWHFNTSKRSEIIDLQSEPGRERFRELASGADVVIETFPPGVLNALGIGYPRLATLNPRLIWTSVTPFGSMGPRANWLANDLILQAIGGLMFLAGMPESPPSQLGGNQAEYLTGVLAACGAMLALFARQKTGHGQHVDISGQEAVALDGENAMPYWDVNQWERPRLGVHNFTGMRQMFQAKDGWVCLAVGSRWKPFRAWAEQAGVTNSAIRDPNWDSAPYRAAHSTELTALLEDLCSRLTREEIYLGGQAVRASVAPVAYVDELFSDPQLAARGFWQSVPHPALEQDVTYPGPPFRLSHSPWQIRGAPPRPGQHTGQGWLPREEPSAVWATGTGELPLSGIRVVDMSWVAAAPLATRLLAHFGAEVIKVETATHPDSSRALRTARPEGNDSLNVSGMWNNLNTGKRSIALDLRHPGALKLLEDLIRTADVLVDNYGVDPYPKWGFTLKRLRELRPDLIIARSSVMGRSGPRSNFIGVGYTIGAASGHNSITGFPGDPPAGACIAHPDYSANPYHFVMAILSALHYRHRTGIGQSIDLAQHESTVCFLGPEAMAAAANGERPGPCANRRPDAAPHGAYPAAGRDQWLAIACETDDQFAALCRCLGRPALAGDPRFAALEARKANEDALDSEVTAWTRTQNAARAMGVLQAAGVPAGVVQSHRVLMDEDPQMRVRSHFVLVEHAEAGPRREETTAIVLSGTPEVIGRPAPMLGEHNDWVFGELLGLPDEQLAAGYVESWFS